MKLKNFSGEGKQEKARQEKEAKERQSGSSVLHSGLVSIEKLVNEELCSQIQNPENEP